MTAIRNTDGKIVCYLDKKTRVIEIKLKGCRTVIKLNPSGEPIVEHPGTKDKL